MGYKGKVIDTPVAPITVTGKSVEESCEDASYVPDPYHWRDCDEFYDADPKHSHEEQDNG